MEERKENWTLHEFLSSITIRDGKKMVCRCTKNATGKKYATLIKTAPEMYELLNRLKDTLSSVPLLQGEIENVLKKARGE